MKYMILLLIGFMTSHASAWQADKDTIEAWTPSAMASLPVVTSTAIAPDGVYVAYTVRETKMEGEDSKYLSHLWVAKSDGSFDRQYTHRDESVSSPAFTPDGKHISFLSKKGEHQQVFMIPIDGGEAFTVTNAKGSISNYKWSPDGSSIAYIMVDPPSEEDKKRKKEKSDVILVDQDYKYNRLYKHVLAADSAMLLFGDDIHVTSFDWSPDGKQIVFAHQPTPRVNDRYKMDLALVSADSGTVESLVSREGTDASPVFSKDGESVLFSSSGGRHEPIGLQDLYEVKLANRQIRKLAETNDRSANIIGLDSEGMLCFSEYEGTNLRLYRLSQDGNSFEKLTPSEGIHSRASFSSESEHFVYVHETPDTPGEVYVNKVSKDDVQKVSQVFESFVFPEMGQTELISWTSKDGTIIEGLVTYPVGYTQGESVPTILMVHGGPAGVYNQSWTGAGSIYAIQYFAANGYALLRPNPRGSTGYGKDFRYANFQDWGYGDYEDLMSGVDRLIETGVADPNNLFEMGWSYGGYMTSWIVTQTDRFNAVSMGAGLSNLISMTGTTDIPNYLTGHMGGPYWGDNMKTYEKHSAIYFVENVSTPTQIIHGKEDLRVPIGQAQEFYWALNERNIPTEMIVYPRTPHGPREPKFLADVSERIFKWFENYKK